MQVGRWKLLPPREEEAKAPGARGVMRQYQMLRTPGRADLSLMPRPVGVCSDSHRPTSTLRHRFSTTVADRVGALVGEHTPAELLFGVPTHTSATVTREVTSTNRHIHLH